MENRTDRVSLYGSLDLTRDNEGLRHAKTMKALMDVVIAALESDKNLPDRIAPPEKPDEVENAFA